MVSPAGFEPAASPSRTERAHLLRYSEIELVEKAGLKPASFACKAIALPIELLPHGASLSRPLKRWHDREARAAVRGGTPLVSSASNCNLTPITRATTRGGLLQVDSERIELSIPDCKTDVFPLALTAQKVPVFPT